jgi:iron-sulfur cluster assembly protein
MSNRNAVKQSRKTSNSRFRFRNIPVMAITLTEAAAAHVANQLDSRGKGLGIRVGVTTTGCSGMAYVLEFVDEPDPSDEVFEDQGIKIIVDPKSLVYIDGTEMDFVKVGVNEGFEFKNPNVKGECGCGESFSV